MQYVAARLLQGVQHILCKPRRVSLSWLLGMEGDPPRERDQTVSRSHPWPPDILFECAAYGLVFCFTPPWRHLWWGLTWRRRAHAPMFNGVHKEQMGLVCDVLCLCPVVAIWPCQEQQQQHAVNSLAGFIIPCDHAPSCFNQIVLEAVLVPQSATWAWQPGRGTTHFPFGGVFVFTANLPPPIHLSNTVCLLQTRKYEESIVFPLTL